MLLSIDPGRKEGDISFTEVDAIQTDFRPVYLSGDILALCNDHTETRILNWRTGSYGILRNKDDTSEEEASIMVSRASTFLANVYDLSYVKLSIVR